MNKPSAKILCAQKICREAHAGQVDKAGAPYYLHPFAVAAKVSGEAAVITALLHDVLEDTDYPPEKLREQFGTEIYAALQALNHHKGESYSDYIGRVIQNRLAAIVKKADMEHNMDLSRLPEITQRDIDRLEKKYKPHFPAVCKAAE